MRTIDKLRLLLIEDDEVVGEALTDRFDLEGFDCVWKRTGREAMLLLQHRRFDIVISDIRLPDMTGEALYTKLLNEPGPLPRYVFITGYGEIDQAVRLLKLGAADYITKPFDIEVLLAKLGDLTLATTPAGRQAVLGISHAMRSLQAMLEKLGDFGSNVLITGESGVGKEVVAGMLHHQQETAGTRPFVAVNCGALSESLLEAELFGHEKGAFTGAASLHKGVFERAHGGTLFLDEIGDMPLPMQVRLLRVIQDRRVTRVGGETQMPVDLRVVCATRKDLKMMVESGGFREDLYYRINVVHLRVPPLRERKEDILWLARRFLDEQSARRGGAPRSLSTRAERVLLDYPWPGNVRELKHAIERACLLSPDGILQPEALFEEMPAMTQSADETLTDHLRTYEREHIIRVLVSHNWHLTRAAATLGISRKNLWERIKRLDIQESAER